MSHIASSQQYRRNLFTGYGLMAAEVAVAFLLTPYIIVKLGVAGYGIWSLMISVIGYMGLVDVGIRGSVGRYINHYLARDDEKAVSEVVGTSTIVLSALAALAGVASIFVANNFQVLFPKTPDALVADVAFVLPLLASGLWLSFMGSIVGNLVAAKEMTFITNVVNLVMLAVRAAAIYWILDAGFGMRGLVMVNLTLGLVGFLVGIFIMLRVFKESAPNFVRFSWARLKEIWMYSVASIAARTASTMANDSAPLIGMWLLGPEAVAIYSVAMTLTQQGRRLIDQANASIFASVMKAGSIKDYAGLRALHIRYMDIAFAIGSLVMIGLMVFSSDFLTLWVGKEYAVGGTVVAILAFGYLAQGVASTANLTLASLDKIGTTVKIGIGEAIACIVLTAALPPLFGMGLIGLALGTTLPRLFTSVVLYPRLSINLLGPELKQPMFAALRRNFVLCLGSLALFALVNKVFPGTTWPLLVSTVAFITVVHLLWLTARNKDLPFVGAAAKRLRKLVWKH